MNIDDRRFLRRHLPSFVSLTPAQVKEVRAACDGAHLEALRTDGVLFYRPGTGSEVWVGWLERTSEGLQLKAKPEPRSLGTVDEYDDETLARHAEAAKLLGSKAKLR